MKLYAKPKVIVICSLFILLFSRLSYWQWERHTKKIETIRILDQRLDEAPKPISDYLPSADWSSLIHRRLRVKGRFDFAHEMILRNRRYDGIPGVIVLTPLQIDGTDTHVVVNRGFIPLTESEPDVRKKFQQPADQEFLGLVKESSYHKFLSPSDPVAGEGHPWIDAWLRVDVPNIQKQLPYPLLPIYLEVMDDIEPQQAREKIVRDSAEREEILTLTNRKAIIDPDLSKYHFPVPMYDIVVPPGRHLGYVFEWGVMAIATALIGLILQLKPSFPKEDKKAL